MIYAPNGSINVILLDPGAGLYSADGYYRVTDATAEVGHVGLYAADGSWNVTILADELTRVPVHAPNGSLNVVDGAGLGVYSPCGALNVTFI